MLDYVKIAGGNLKTAKTGERPEMENTHYIRDSYRNVPGMHHCRVKFFMKKLSWKKVWPKHSACSSGMLCE